jgi:outer membrane protein assembly factor BamB
MLEKREFDRSNFMWRVSATITAFSGVFALIVFILLLANYIQIRNADPMFDETITQMRVEYSNLPDQDDALAKRIQTLDLLNRKAFFTSQQFLRFGSFLLLISVSVFLISFKNMIRWKRELPALAEVPTAEKEFIALRESRNLITWAGVGILAVGLLSAFMTESFLLTDPDALLAAMEAKKEAAESPSESEGEADDESAILAAAIEQPDWETVEKHWPTFRGPGSNGIAINTTAPLDWNLAEGTNVKWKVENPKHGTNSPVIWGNKLFLTGADEEEFNVYCYDTETGELIWSKPVGPFPNTPKDLPEVSEETGYAACSMAIHGEQVFAIFANGDIASFDFDGIELWGTNLGVPTNSYGHSSSLIAFDDKLYVQMDDMEGPRLVALDVATGKPTWTKERELVSWASPILAQTELGPQLILNSTNYVDGYNPIDGTLLWSQECLDGEVAPSPAYSNGVVFVANEYAMGTAIQLAGTPDTVESTIKWEYDNYLPEVASPVGDGERFYFGTAVGDIVCIDAATGEELWVAEVETGFYSSPIIVGDRLYIADMDGNMYIVKTSSEYELLKMVEMGEETLATPAFIQNRIYLRTVDNLYCIE